MTFKISSILGNHFYTLIFKKWAGSRWDGLIHIYYKFNILLIKIKMDLMLQIGLYSVLSQHNEPLMVYLIWSVENVLSLIIQHSREFELIRIFRATYHIKAFIVSKKSDKFKNSKIFYENKIKEIIRTIKATLERIIKMLPVFYKA